MLFIGFRKVGFQKTILNPAYLTGYWPILMIYPLGPTAGAIQITGAVIDQVNEGRRSLLNGSLLINDPGKQGVGGRLIQGWPLQWVETG